MSPSQAIEQQERVEEDDVVAWWCAKKSADPNAYECSSFIDFLFTYKSHNPEVPQIIWNYFNYEQFLHDLVMIDDTYTLIYKVGDTYKVFPEVPSAWKGQEFEWFNGHPCKDCFYILRYTGA
jgi:hypothetical protein